MINKDLYITGEEQFYNKHWELSDKEYEAELEDSAWNAYYNDMYKVDTVEEGYFLIAEAYSTELANKYLTECIEAGIYHPNEAA